ncbi:MAG: hypothetical protein ACHQEB_06960 [Chitinophagales bacterium]
MKKLLLLLSAGVLLIACNNEKKTEGPKNTDLISQNLKGKVQHTEEMEYAVDSTGKMGAMDSIINTQDFNEKGYQSGFASKNSKGETKSAGMLTQYDNGATKSVESKTKGVTSFRMEIGIDSNGKYNSAKSFDSSGKMTSYYKDLTENEYGEVLTGTEYHMDNTLKSSFVNSYDKDGHNIGGVGKDSTGKETFHSVIKLNDKGDPIEQTTTTVMKDSTKTETVTYKYDSYDDQGNWTQRTEYNDKGKATKIVKHSYTYYKD